MINKERVFCITEKGREKGKSTVLPFDRGCVTTSGCCCFNRKVPDSPSGASVVTRPLRRSTQKRKQQPVFSIEKLTDLGVKVTQKVAQN